MLFAAIQKGGIGAEAKRRLSEPKVGIIHNESSKSCAFLVPLRHLIMRKPHVWLSIGITWLALQVPNEEPGCHAFSCRFRSVRIRRAWPAAHPERRFVGSWGREAPTGWPGRRSRPDRKS